MQRGQHLPGFKLTIGFTLTYLSLLVIIPLIALIAKTAQLSWAQIYEITTDPQVVAAYKVSFKTALIAALINLFIGGLLAWVLVRYKFFGRKIIDALIDLPFVLPTAVTGITLAALYSPKGWVGQWIEKIEFLKHLEIKLAYSTTGIVLALIFIGLPFVVRTVQPVLQDLEKEQEEAAASLGANRWQTIRYVIFPRLLPALLTGFALAFARSVGEYGSVIFIAGNISMETEIAPLIIIQKLEQYDYLGATAVASIMLLISFIILLTINSLQIWFSRKQSGAIV